MYRTWLGWILWHINHCRLFNTKYSLYIHIKNIGFGLAWFYGISTIVSYLMPNSLYTYISNIYDLVGFYGLSTIVGYLMTNSRYKKLVPLVEGDLKAPFSIATTQRCRGGHYSIPWIAPLYSSSLLYNAEC